MIQIGSKEEVALLLALFGTHTQQPKPPKSTKRRWFLSERLPGAADAFRRFGGNRTTELSFPSLFRSLGVSEFRRKTIRIRSRVPTPEEARQLKMAPSVNVLVTEVTNVDANDVPVVHAFTCFSSSHVELVVDL